MDAISLLENDRATVKITASSIGHAEKALTLE